MYKISVSAYSGKGNFREKNEDNFFVDGVYLPVEHIDDKLGCELKDDKQRIFSVFDGLGGEAIGEVASGMAAELMRDYAESDFDFDGYFRRANEKILAIKSEHRVKGCGTTVVMAKLKGGKMRIANIGDSSAYLIRRNKIKVLHEEHTIFSMMRASGVVSEDEGIRRSMKNTLTQCLGMDEDIEIKPYISNELRLMSGDIVLLCSDGLSGSVNEDKIKLLLSKNKKEPNIAEKLADAAVESGTKDNVTVIVMVIKSGLLDMLANRSLKIKNR